MDAQELDFSSRIKSKPQSMGVYLQGADPKIKLQMIFCFFTVCTLPFKRLGSVNDALNITQKIN